MRILNTALFFLLGDIVNKAIASPIRERYIAHYPAHYAPFLTISEEVGSDVETIFTAPYRNAEWVFDSANLTTAEYETVRKEIEKIGGVIEKDELVKLVDDLESITIDDPEETNFDKRIGKGSQNPSPYLNNVPQCNALTDNVEYIVVDSLVYQDNPEFSNLKITIGTNFAGTPQPCLDHGSKVTSVIAGKTLGMIPSGDRSVYNIPVFDCTGNGFIFSIMGAFSEALKRGKANLKIGRRTVVNFSGTGSKLDILNRAASSIVESGIPFAAASGNKGINACDNASPASAGKVFTIGATQSPGDIPAVYSNWGPTNGCVDVYLPGTDSVINVVTNRTTSASGTSFASPIGAGFLGMELAANPKATPAQVQANIMSRTTIVSTPRSSAFSADIAVMSISNACKGTKLFNTYSTILTNNGELLDWFKFPSTNNFCVKFGVRVTNNQKGSLLIGLRKNAADKNIIKISIDDNATGKKFNHSIKVGDATIAFKITNTKVVTTTARQLLVKQSGNSLLVQYFNKKNIASTLLNGTITEFKAQEVAFGNAGKGEAIYKNALTC